MANTLKFTQITLNMLKYTLNSIKMEENTMKFLVKTTQMKENQGEKTPFPLILKLKSKGGVFDYFSDIPF